ncbi:5431_t:CDS:1 [Paraglomus occultum]|uniref:5431_t:CDS:1 n=1 Tax=Paraglomus occultum TaxID=144539 RepID=A0A9N8ZQ20_9GLOM|nr:5431_t:CDS:1 [Paraglomus occultum]
MAKITKQEFENYHQEFLSAFSRIMCTSEFKSMGKEDQEKIEKIFGLLLNEIQSGNILALYGSCEEVEGKLNEDYSAIKRRVKEHIIARGYYNPASPLSLAEFRERMKKRGWKNFKELWENKEQIKKLLSEMNEENRNFIKSTFYLFEQIDEIVQDKEEKE